MALLWKRFCQESDKKAFEILFYRFNESLIKFCSAYIHDQEAAEEIVSDVFVNCWLNRQQLILVNNPKTYLFVAVKNRAFNYIKKYSSIKIVSLEHTDNLAFIDMADPNRQMERKELFFKMDQLIHMLPQQSRLVFKLIKEDGLKYKEVAELLCISPRTVQTHLSRAMKKLSDFLQGHLQQEKQTIKDKLLFISLTTSILHFFIYFL